MILADINFYHMKLERKMKSLLPIWTYQETNIIHQLEEIFWVGLSIYLKANGK